MRRLLRLACLAAAGALTSCAGALPDIDPVRDAAAAAGVADAIVFRDDAEPIEVAVPQLPVLTIADAVRAALQHDPSLQEALALARVALADANQARRWPNPILNVFFRFPEGGGKMEIDAGLGADVLTMLQTPQRAAAADHRLEAACAMVVAATIEVIANVQAAYARLQALDAEAPALQSRVEAAERLVALGQARLAAGDSTQLDLAELDALRLQLKLETVERSRERAASQLQLLRLLGAPGASPPFVLASWQEPAALAATEESLVAVALQRRPELAAARAEVQALGDDLDLAGLSWLAGAQLGAGAQREGAWSLGPLAALPLPLFDDGSTRQQGVRAELLAARHRATSRGREIVQATRTSIADAEAADARLTRVRQELLPLQQRRRALAEAAYHAGEADVGVVLRAEQDLRAAEGALVLLQRDLWLARIGLERAVGGPTALAVAEQQGRKGKGRP